VNILSTNYIFLSLISALGWSISSIFVKLGVCNKSPIAINIIRLYVSSIFWVIVFFVNKNWTEFFLNSHQVLILILSAFLGLVLSGSSKIGAIKYIGISKTVSIFYSYSFWVFLWSWLILGRVITENIVMGAILIFLSIILITQTTKQEDTKKIKGILLAMFASFCEGSAMVATDWVSSQISSLTLAGTRVILGTSLISLVLFKYIKEIKYFNKREFLFASLAGLSGPVFAQYIAIEAIKLKGSQMVAPIFALTPLISSLLAIFFLRERPNKRVLLAVVFSTIGLILIRLN